MNDAEKRAQDWMHISDRVAVLIVVIVPRWRAIVSGEGRRASYLPHSYRRTPRAAEKAFIN